MPVTIGEIAKKTGVSRSTVSRALNDHPRISDATKRKVHNAARELGYIPNYLAQSLSGSRSRSLGMVITHMADPYIWQVVDGVEQTAYEHGYTVFVSMAHGDRSKEITIIEEYQRRRVDGIIVTSSHLVRRYGEQLKHIQIPVVLINNHAQDENLRGVSINARAAAQTGVAYLISLGHRAIAYVTVPDRVKSTERRYQGYADALDAAGLAPRVIQTGWDTLAPFAYIDYELGRTAAEKLLRANVTAVFCYNDMIALGLIAGMRARGVLVPDHLSVMGFDDIDLAQLVLPALTTIRQPRLELGRVSARLLFAALDGQPVERRVLNCELIIRDSTRPL